MHTEVWEKNPFSPFERVCSSHKEQTRKNGSKIPFSNPFPDPKNPPQTKLQRNGCR